jgi:flagellar motor switch protein FliN/FliY
VADDNDDLLDPSEIEALLNAGGSSSAPEDGPADPAATLSESTDAAADQSGGSDLLDASDIEALMKGAGCPAPAAEESSTAPQTSSSSAGESDVLDASDIEALLQQQSPGPSAAASDATSVAGRTEQLLDQAEADLAAAVAPNIGSGDNSTPELGSARPFEFESFEPGADKTADAVALKSLQDVELDLRIELGRTELLIEDVLKLKSGSVVPLDKLAGDPVDIIVNGRLIARGEVLVLNDNFCVRVAEILTPEG